MDVSGDEVVKRRNMDPLRKIINGRVPTAELT